MDKITNHIVTKAYFVKPIKGCKSFEELIDKTQAAIEALSNNPHLDGFTLISVSHDHTTAESWNGAGYSNCKIYNSIITYSYNLHLIAREDADKESEDHE